MRERGCRLIDKTYYTILVLAFSLLVDRLRIEESAHLKGEEEGKGFEVFFLVPRMKNVKSILSTFAPLPCSFFISASCNSYFKASKKLLKNKNI